MKIFQTILALIAALGMLATPAADRNTIDEKYFAVLHGGVGERTYETYVYKTDKGYKYVNVTSTTVSWGSPQWKHEVNKRGTASTREQIAEIAAKHGATGYCTYFKDYQNTHSIQEFIDGPKYSEKYLVGFDFGGSSWGDYYQCISAGIVICTNGELQVTMPTKVENYNVTDPQIIGTFQLTEKQYRNIEKALDKEKLFTIDPEPDDRVCDGYSIKLLLYDENDKVLRNCGGYMPQNEYLMDTYHLIMDNIPSDEIAGLWARQIEFLRGQDDRFYGVE